MTLFTRDEFKAIMRRGLKKIWGRLLFGILAMSIISALGLIVWGGSILILNHPLGALIFFCPFVAFLVVFFTGLEE